MKRERYGISYAFWMGCGVLLFVLILVGMADDEEAGWKDWISGGETWEMVWTEGGFGGFLGLGRGYKGH